MKAVKKRRRLCFFYAQRIETVKDLQDMNALDDLLAAYAVSGPETGAPYRAKSVEWAAA